MTDRVRNDDAASACAVVDDVRKHIVVGTRIHWNNHAQDQRIQVDATLQQVHALCARAATFAKGIVIAVGLPRASIVESSSSRAAVDSTATFISLDGDTTSTACSSESVFVASVREFLARLQRETSSSAPTSAATTFRVKIVPMLHWGSFVPALNAIIATAATQFPRAPLLLLQSLEVDVDATGVNFLASRFQLGRDLVVGAALPGHTFTPRCDEPHVLTGLTTPWNTLALWDLTQLARIGFPLIGDGLRLNNNDNGSSSSNNNAGVEEVATIALYQHVFPTTSAATVVRVPSVAWQVDAFESVERQEWQQRKMQSKQQRAATQLTHFGLRNDTGSVWHIDN